MFTNTEHGNEVERLGLAQAYGFAAASHLDIVIERLKRAVSSLFNSIMSDLMLS